MSQKIRIATKQPDRKKNIEHPQTRKSVSSQPTNSPIDHILFLQRTIGNQAVQRLFKSGMLQAKLKIGQPGDKYEQEADRLAEQVMRMPESQCPECEEEEPIMRKGISGNTSEAKDNLYSRLSLNRGVGQSLPEADRAFMERRFKADFSSVRIHTDSNAAQISRELNAEAFTYGRDIYFGAGRYNPATLLGKRLLAHELTHVVQQVGEKSSGPIEKKKISVNERDQEQEPDSIAGDVSRGHRRPISMNRITVTQSSKSAIRKQESLPVEISAEERRHAGESELMFSYCGFVHQTLRESRYNRYIEEARSTTISNVIRWARRGSTRSIRTADTSSRMYNWLEAHVSNFPGRIRLEENQYWKLNPELKKMWLCTIYKRTREQTLEREESEEKAPAGEADGKDISVMRFDLVERTVRGGINLRPNFFGGTNPWVDISRIEVYAIDFPHFIAVWVVVPLEYRWDIQDLGRTNISGADDPDVTEYTWRKIVYDLTPTGSPPVAPFTKYWCRDLVEEHEMYHIDELKHFYDFYCFVADEWLGRQQASSEADARQKANQAISDMFRKVDKERKKNGFELRAYLHEAPLLLERVQAIINLAMEEGWL